MYRTKQDVDRHVSSVLARIKDEKERNARGYQIAKLYYEAKEYEIARRYLAGFLSIRENLPQAHKLMGFIHEASGQSAQAVASYKRSLELDDKQKDVVYKICEQYSKTDVDPDRALFWAEKGEKLFPNNKVVFKLKERAVSGQGGQNFKEMESLISAELVKRPTDADLRIRLLKLYVGNGRVNEAYDHAVQIEHTLAYVDSLPWYEYLVELFGIFQQAAGCAEDCVFYSLKLSALQNFVHLTLRHRDVVDSAEALHIFDLCLHQALQIPKPTQEWQALLREMKGQFFFLAGTLLLKRAQKNQLTWRDATCVGSACYLAGLQFSPLNPQAEWYVRAPTNKLKTNDRLLKISHFRCSQTGHMLNVMCRGDKSQWAVDLRQRHCTPQGRDKLFDTLFTLREMKTLKPKSFLMQSKVFCDFDITLPTPDHLAGYDSVAHLLQPEDLHNLVWLALQHYSSKDTTQPKYDFNIFSTLQYTTTTSLENAAPESLCQLDVEAFLYATVRCTALQLQESRLILPQDGSQPELLPSLLCKALCSKEQAEWWEAAYKLYANIAKENFPRLRLVLQRGLEAVRVGGNHGMSVTLIVHLAKTLEERVTDLKAKPDRDSMSDPMVAALETRTAHYWQKALEILRKMDKNQPVRAPKERLFAEDGSKQLNSRSIKELIGDGEFYLAVLSMANQQHVNALTTFETLERPYASYYSAQIYKQLANTEICGKTKDQLTPDVRSKYEALLIKAREAYYLTLDRLRGDKNHELNKLLSRDLDDIETRLSRAETEEGILNDSINLSVNSEDFESPIKMSSIQPLPSTTPGRMPFVAQSTPNIKPLARTSLASILDEDRVHVSMSEMSGRVRPSPERLEAQMRALTFSQETLLKTVMDRNEELVRNNKEIMDELRETRSLNKQLQDSLSQLNQARLMGAAPFLPQGLSQTLPAGSPYMVGAPLQGGSFPYSPQPSWMPQYGYQMPNPTQAGGMRIASPNRLAARHHPVNQGDFYSGPPYSFATVDLEEGVVDRDDNEEEDPYHIDGEYFVDEGAGAQPYYMQDIQDWPYGNRAGIEGKSTITYQPHMRPPVPQPGLVGAGLRGQSLQYGYRPPTAQPVMPGPGYFSSPQTHASVYPSNTMTQSPLAGALTTNPQGLGSPSLTTTTPAGQVMPPNVVAGQAIGMRPSVPGSVVNRPQMAGKSPSVTVPGQGVPQPPTNAGQAVAMQKTPAQKPSQPAGTGQTTTPTLPEGVSLLFAGRATITFNANKPQYCNLKMFHIVRGNRLAIAMQAVTETKEVVMNHEFTSDVQVKPQMFVPDTFVWTKTGSSDKFVLKFNDSNETAGFSLAVEKVKVLLQNIAAAKELAPAGTASAPALTKSNQPSPQQPGSSAAATLSQLAAKHKETPTKPAQVYPPAVDAAKGDAGKSVFGGFTFKSAPVISSPAAPGSDERQKAVPSGKAQTSPAKTSAKPFEGFSFASPSSQSAALTKPGNQISQAQSKSPGMKLTGVKDSPGRREDDAVDEYEPTVDFQPVIPLPDLVEVKTGEEEEDKLFSERCRLFRFDPETKQWKERGVGEMKILLHKQTNRIRIIMRRDQVLKLCANHYLSADMKLSKMASSDKSWCWNAVDYADEEVKNEQLAARFKNADIAANFKAVFEDSINKIKADSEVTSSTDAPASMPPATTADASETKAAAADTQPLSELFKPAEGSWECSGCFIRNDGSVKKCPACGTLKPGVKPEDVKEVPSSTSFGATGASGSGFKFGSSGFTFGATASTGFTFGGSPAAGSKDASVKPAPDSSTGFVFGSATNQSKEASGKTAPDSSTGFVFGSPAVQSKDASSKTVSSNTSGFTFSASAQNKEGIKPSGDNSGFVFGKADVKKEAPSNKAAEVASGLAPAIKHEASKPDGKEASKSDSSKPLSELFKKPEGSWECSGCLIVNGADIQKCPACGTLQPGVKPEDVKQTSGLSGFQTPASGFSFGASSTESSISSTGFVFGSTSSGNKPSGFSFGTPTTTTTATTIKAENQPSPQGKTLKDLLQSDSPAAGASSLTKDIAQSESTEVSSTTTKTPVASKSLFGSAITGTPVAASGAKGSASDSFVFGSPLTKFTFTGVSTPTSSVKPAAITSPKSPEVDDHGHYVNKEGEDSHIFFEPVVDLPDKVDVKTGEEDETVLFESRAKLYRFDNNEWKERGLGVVKLLQHKVNSKIRILMRRDQILKICCNHHITAEMELKPMMKTEGKAWIWHAVDFADEDHQHQQLAIRFKTPELGNKFREVFELGTKVSSTGKSPLKPTKDDDVVFVKEEKATPEQVAKARSYKLPDNFYLYENAPACPGCLGCVDGDHEELAKLLKTSPAPQQKRSPRKSESEKTAATTLFGSAATTQADSEVGGALIFGNQSSAVSFSSLAQPTGALFGSKSDSQAGDTASLFGTKAGTISFASLAQSSDKPFAAKSGDNKPFAFSGAGSQLFGAKKEGGDGGGDDDEVAPSNDIHFEPIISLPEMEVKTGEEDEEVLFCQRSKLFRFDKEARQWKERGIGEMKVLKHKQTGAYRLLQRREQVLKISCNHLLTPELQLKPMSTSDTSWCWTAQDYAEGEPRIEQFAIKFKNVTLAKEFKEIFENCQNDMVEKAKRADVVEEVVEPSVTRSSGFVTGDNGNVYYTRQLDKSGVVEEVVEPSMTSLSGFVTGDTGNVYYTRHLDKSAGVVEEVVEPSVTSSSAFVTGDNGNVYYTRHLDKSGVVEEVVEPSMTSSSGFVTGDTGNVYYTRQLDKSADVVEEVVEPSVTSSSGFVTGDTGNVYYTRQLDKSNTEEENKNTSFPVQESDRGDNSAVSEPAEAKEEEETGEEETGEEETGEEEYEDEDDEDYEDILETIFEKRATLSSYEDNTWKVLGMGDLKVLYDDDVTAHRIAMETDDQVKVCNHIISKESSLSSDTKKVCQWAAVDFSTDEPVKRVFMAQFSSTPALKEFTELFHKGVQLAIESDISDRGMMTTFPREIVRPEVVCSPGSKEAMGGYGGFGYNNHSYLIQSATSTQMPASRVGQSASSFTASPPADTQPAVPFASDVNQSELETWTASQSKTTSVNTQSAPWIQQNQGVAVPSANEVPTQLLGTCCPEISATLDEILLQGNEPTDSDINSLD